MPARAADRWRPLRLPRLLKGRLAPISSNSLAAITFTGNEGPVVETQEAN